MESMGFIIKDLLNLKEDFILHVEDKNKSSVVSTSPTVTTSNNSYSSYKSLYHPSDYRMIYLYESVGKSPMLFYKVSDFLNYADANGIIISSYMANQLRCNPCNFCSVRPTSSTLIIKTKYASLVQELEHNNKTYAYSSDRDSYENGGYPRDFYD